MPSKYTQANIDRGAYIPPAIAQAMNQHMQQSMPVHLRKYVGENRPGYVPRSAERAIAAAMDKSMPAQYKQYTGAYMQQNILNPRSTGPGTPLQPTRPTPHPPNPSLLRRDHNMPVGQQFTADPNMLPEAAEQMFQTPSGEPGQPGATTSAETPPPVGPTEPNYDFILNPPPTPKAALGLPSLPGLGPAVTRIFLVLGGLIVLVILYGIIKGALGGPSNVPAFNAVVADQQEILHLTLNASNEPDLSGVNQNFIATTQLTVTSAQLQLYNYMSKGGHKPSGKQLSAKLSSATDSSLTAAETSGTFNPTFTSVMQQQLATYKDDLSAAYKLTPGKIGRGYLSSDYSQAGLLLTQLNGS